jgi:hypothetical protein
MSKESKDLLSDALTRIAHGWFVREVMPSIQRTGQWIWPDNLDVTPLADCSAGDRCSATVGG